MSSIRIFLRLSVLLVCAIGICCGALVPPIAQQAPAGGAKKPARGAHFKEVVASLQETATPGALGRLASVVVLHPLDTIKTRAQVVSMQTRRTAETAIFRSPANFKGVLPAILGQVPNGLLTCVGYELWKDLLFEKFPKMPRRQRTVASAVLGDLTGQIWMVPAEVLKVQLQMGLHLDMGSAIRRIAGSVLPLLSSHTSYHGSAGAAGFFRGWKAQVMRDVPYRALQIILFDELSRGLVKSKSRRSRAKGLSMGETLGAGAVAGRFNVTQWFDAFFDGLHISNNLAAAMTTPLDMVRTRMMMQAKKSTLLEVLQSAASMEGLSVFTGSVAPKMIYVGASVRICNALNR